MGLPKIAPYPLPLAEDLPQPRAPWQPDAARAALLIHDMQGYFCAAFAPDAAPLAPAVENIARLAALCRRRGLPVFYTAQTGNQDRRDRGLQADLWGPGMTARPEHEDILPALAPQQGDLRLVKHRYSAFINTDLNTVLKARNIQSVLVCGVATNVCVETTARDAYMFD